MTKKNSDDLPIAQIFQFDLEKFSKEKEARNDQIRSVKEAIDILRQSGLKVYFSMNIREGVPESMLVLIGQNGLNIKDIVYNVLSVYKIPASSGEAYLNYNLQKESKK